MLTIVPGALQLQFPVPLLTLVPMTTMQERLQQAMDYAKKNKADLARACGISRTAVSKWFDSGKNLKMEHLFAVADECVIDARWLATGEGSMKPAKGTVCAHADIPPRRIDLIRSYGRLPDDLRRPIRAMIETLSVTFNDRVQEHYKRIEEYDREFRKKSSKVAAKT
jgi:transcriptional regulator with XRE-family HTH domain